MAVVIYDAMGVRRAAGEQAKVINRMVDIMEKEGSEITEKDLKEYLGHTPIEVLAGLLLGILVSLALL
jgi:acid phosphatase family membrane protein YuiD